MNTSDDLLGPTFKNAHLFYCAACAARGEKLRHVWEPVLSQLEPAPPLDVKPTRPTGRCLACDGPVSTTRGRFVVLEGLDGTGKSTHARLLVERLEAAGVKVHRTREPSDGPVGTFIREAIARRELDGPGEWLPDADVLALLFAADRVDHVRTEVEPVLDAGVWVVSDRYLPSSLAYQTGGQWPDEHFVQNAIDLEHSQREWVSTLNRKAIVPDLTIVLDLDPDLAAARRSKREGRPDLIEGDRERMQKAAEYYRKMHFFRSVHVDANAPREEVAERVWNATAELRTKTT